jgi:BCD family chlorophyll transporter-like MFS transporter
MALGGGLRDLVAGLSSHGLLGPALMDPSVAYSVVYHIEIALLFITLVAIGPLVRLSPNHAPRPSSKFGLAELPG